jgi:hypothetical protein
LQAANAEMMKLTAGTQAPIIAPTITHYANNSIQYVQCHTGIFHRGSLSLDADRDKAVMKKVDDGIDVLMGGKHRHIYPTNILWIEYKE